MHLFSRLLLTLCVVLGPSLPSPLLAQTATAAAGSTGTEQVAVHFFERDGCGYCAKEKAFLETLQSDTPNITVIAYNLSDTTAKATFDRIVQKYNLAYATPVTVIGETVLQGFDSDQVAGVRIRNAIEAARTSPIRTIEDLLGKGQEPTDANSNATSSATSTCTDTGEVCDTTRPVGALLFDLPLIGIVDLGTFSLTTLSIVLGFIDGFNPCAMWVLVTFLIVLSQVGSRKRMLYVAGIFILAEGVMYNLILNVWYKTWDFVGLDAIVTPIVGLVALGGGGYFLYRYWKNRKSALTCDVSDLESQAKTTGKIQALAVAPITILSFFGIVGLAFSINVIEFACSIGIPQTFTKILELNHLSFLGTQWYMLLYSFFYMIDDLVIFALAIWGFSKLQSIGHTYSQISLLVGGVLMLVLSMFLLFNPALLVF